MTRYARRIGIGLTVASLVGVACGGGSQSAAPRRSVARAATAAAVIDPGDDGTYHPAIDPGRFVGGVANPYLPLRPGAKWVYEGTSDGETERVEVVVTDKRREIMGIPAVVVRDTVSIAGEMVEDTYDWFAQDRDGNVWYLGEDSNDYENGKLVSKSGSWEAGVDGALPGIVMPAHPKVGDAYRQEFFAGEAEDMGEVLRVGASHSIGLGHYRDVVVVEEWTPLEPDVVEQKYYAPGVGKIYGTHTAGPEGSIELVDYTPGS